MPDLTQSQMDQINTALKGELNSGSFDSMMTAQEVPSVIRMILEAAKEKQNSFLRGDFADDLQALAAVRHMAKCMEFKDVNGQLEIELINNARSAINAKRVDTAVRAVIGNNQLTAKTSWKDRIKAKAGVE